VVLLFAWGTIAAFCPVSTNDLWLLLREAADIVASGEIPRVEQYSAVAVGRPYLAHEWLSGLIFLGIFKLGGGEALTVLRASVMLAMLLLLWYSLEKKDRSFMLAAPLLALAAYTILTRVFVRPHIFTHLFLCVWVFSLEHWRRERRLRYLIMLVPLQVLWANLHGGYIFALVLGALMTGTGLVKRRKLRLVGCGDVRRTDCCLPGRQPGQSLWSAVAGIFTEHWSCQRLYQAIRL
jgi:hypothetical protein